MAARREVDFLPDRLNEEPVVFLAMTNSEIQYVALLCLAVWIPASTLVGALCGYALMGFALSLAGVFGSLWLIGRRLRVLKRGKPRQYHVMAIRAALQDRGLAPRTLIRESRAWDIRRWRSP
jgi:conjugative transfer region protein (TIGR03750 family)